jgi:hypothetical protein
MAEEGKPPVKRDFRQISGTTTYGGYFNLPGRDLYTALE